MTDRLYYDNTYLSEFDAAVVECVRKDAGFAVRLDRSAFYPTSGGQPYDTGTIGEAAVTDVYVDDAGEVWHIVDTQLETGSEYHCKIDWARRFDHMQQHAGEHMLANAAYRLLGGWTIGLHLGSDVSTIDMTLPEGRTHITAEELRALEDDVNMRIQQDVPIKQWFPEKDELKALPLRKPPTVDEHVRVVQIGDLEFCACGGTHPSSAGQIGLFKIVYARPSRGKLRIAFVCGKRAYELLRANYDMLHATADMLSTSVENVEGIVRGMNEDIKRLNREISALRTELLIKGAEQMLTGAAVNENGVKIVAVFADGDMNSARDLCTHLISFGRIVVVAGVKTANGFSYVVARSSDTDCACGAALSAAAKKCGGKGGGKPDFAQGGGPAEMLELIKDECFRTAR